MSRSSKAEALDYFELTPSDNHVARLENRQHQPTINWPTDDEFGELIAQISNVRIAKMLGCTEAAVRKKRKKRSI
ncbi:hypothetical protein N9R65_04505 [Opitutales bacterium]|nr:hypothetical protein [Opitutales bacterium]MDB2682301.1 hypothetical protein [Opitutales bacterium]